MTQPQAPGYQGTTQATPRVLTRGRLEYFVFSFHYDQARLQPVVPQDATRYPSYRVSAPNGEILAQGVGVVGGSPGEWKVGWVVPRNAVLTTPNQRYRFQVVMIDANVRQFETSFEFDVVEAAVPAQEPEAQQYVSFVGESVRLSFVNTVRPDMLRLRVTPRGVDGSTVHYAAWTYPIPVPPTSANLLEAQRGDAYVYYTDTPVIPVPGEYSAIWTCRDTPLSANDMEHQAITIITSSAMFLVKSLRILIDKLQKKLGLVFAYTNEDLIDYLKNGMAFVNSYSPPTNYTYDNLPAALEAFAVLAAAWWGLTAQRLLFAETNLNFSGQTVTLDYNPGADLDSIISSFKDTLDNQLKSTKKNLFRQASGVGAIATRPYRFRTNIVYKVNYGMGSDIIARLMEFGLLDW